MHEYSTRLIYLFDLYYAGEATSEQTAELMTMISEGKHDRQLNRLLEEAWKKQHGEDTFFQKHDSENILNAILESARANGDDQADGTRPVWKSARLWRWTVAAAVLIVGIGAFYNFKSNKPTEKIAIVKPQVKDLPPGGNRALLTLADGSTIVLDSAANGVLAMQGKTKISKKENGQLVYDSENEDNKQSVTQMNMLSTPKGGQYQIFLPDGSKVWLNSLSSIKYPAAFPKNERKVEITGEVFFEVQKDKSRPFKAVFGETVVEVLGTSFNVMAYQDDQASRTTLVEGAVSLTNNHINKRLRPGEQASVGTSGNITTQMVDIEEAIAWKKGLFYFKSAGVEQIMKKAARWYDIKIRYDGGIPSKRFTGKIPMDVNVSELMQMLNYAGVACRFEDNQVIVSGKAH